MGSDRTVNTASGDALAPGIAPEDRLACVAISDGSASDAAGPGSFESWRDSVRPLFEVESRDSISNFRSTGTYFNVDGLIFTHNLFSGSTYHRDARRVRGGENDFISLHLPIRGHERGAVGDQTFLMAPDRITIQDWAHPYRSAAEPTEKLGIAIPRNRLASRDWFYERSPVTTWHLDSASGRLLAATWRSIWEQLSHTRTADAPELAAAFIGMLDGLVATKQDASPSADAATRSTATPDPSETPLAAMRSFIEEHLDHPDLGPDMLAAAFCCSRATIYRWFGSSGGIQAYIRDRRLTRCYHELTAPHPTYRHIYEVAERWGFSNASHFHREFKRRFGRSPSDIARTESHQLEPLTSPRPQSPLAIPTLHRWLTTTDPDRAE